MRKAGSHGVTTADPNTGGKTTGRAVGVGSHGIAPLVMQKDGFLQKQLSEAWGRSPAREKERLF